MYYRERAMPIYNACNTVDSLLSGVPIFVVLVEGPINKFKCPKNGNFLYEL